MLDAKALQTFHAHQFLGQKRGVRLGYCLDLVGVHCTGNTAVGALSIHTMNINQLLAGEVSKFDHQLDMGMLKHGN